jgi:hypothetical protein
MTQQMDLLTHTAGETDATDQGGEFVLVPPSLYPTGAEAAERRLARMREVEDRKRETKGMIL